MSAFSIYAASRHTSYREPRASVPPLRPPSSALRRAVLDDASSSVEIHGGRDGAFDAAVALYEQGRWADAFKALMRLADLGHAAAAKLALLMLRYGAALYGTALCAEAQQIARWAALVIDAGKPRTSYAGRQ
ncbi:MAG: hypothetical protein JSR59_09720 [Proteobacteria bacterium]|nr:hypothetical protein [Pseudomonadota bacterium]